MYARNEIHIETPEPMRRLSGQNRKRIGSLRAATMSRRNAYYRRAREGIGVLDRHAGRRAFPERRSGRGARPLWRPTPAQDALASRRRIVGRFINPASRDKTKSRSHPRLM